MNQHKYSHPNAPDTVLRFDPAGRMLGRILCMRNVAFWVNALARWTRYQMVAALPLAIAKRFAMQPFQRRRAGMPTARLP
jgi:hypothetical protein